MGRFDLKSSGENWRGKGGASSPDTPQARSSGTDRTHSCPDAPALDKGRLPQPLPTRDQAKPPRSSPGRLLRPALLTCSSCQPPSVPFCAEWTATSRSAPPFPVFPGLHTYHPQHKQTPGRASPLIPPPASHPRRACAHPAPTPAGPAPSGARASVQCLPEPAPPNGQRGGSGRNGKGRGKERGFSRREI